MKPRDLVNNIHEEAVGTHAHVWHGTKGLSANFFFDIKQI